MVDTVLMFDGCYGTSFKLIKHSYECFREHPRGAQSLFTDKEPGALRD